MLSLNFLVLEKYFHFVMCKVLLALSIMMCLTHAQQNIAPANALWNITLPRELSGTSYYAFSVDPSTKATPLLLASKITYFPSTYSPNPVVAFDPDSGEIIWSSHKYPIVDFRNDVILAVTGNDNKTVQGIVPGTEDVLFSIKVPGNSTLYGIALSGPYFAMVVDQGATLVGVSVTTGMLLWTKTNLNIGAVVGCSGDDFCIKDNSGYVTYVGGATGDYLWTHVGVAVSSHGSSKDYVIIGDGSYLNNHMIYLVDAKTGRDIWTTDLGFGNNGYDFALSDEVALISYIIVGRNYAQRVGKRNAYPSAFAAFDLKTGKNKYNGEVPGPTMGIVNFFDDGDFVVIGGAAIARIDGQTGKAKCGIFPTQDYNVYTQPGTWGDSFFVLNYSFGWGSQFIARLTCSQ